LEDGKKMVEHEKGGQNGQETINDHTSVIALFLYKQLHFLGRMSLELLGRMSLELQKC